MNVVNSGNKNLSIFGGNIVFESDQSFSQVSKCSIDRGSYQRQSCNFLQDLFKWSVECSFTTFMDWIDLEFLQSVLIILGSSGFILNGSVPIQISIGKSLR